MAVNQAYDFYCSGVSLVLIANGTVGCGVSELATLFPPVIPHALRPPFPLLIGEAAPSWLTGRLGQSLACGVPVDELLPFLKHRGDRIVPEGAILSELFLCMLKNWNERQFNAGSARRCPRDMGRVEAIVIKVYRESQLDGPEGEILELAKLGARIISRFCHVIHM
jgi:hypothetical protein